MSVRIFAEVTSRVVERPRALAAATSSRLTASICCHNPSSASRSANAAKNWVMALSGTEPSCANAAVAWPTHCSTSARSAAGTCKSSPVPCTTSSESPGANAAASAAETRVMRLPPKTIGMPS
jgi:hypothetical protein